jgi:hypothetical protein
MFMMLATTPLIARWYARRRMPWAFVAVLISVLVFVVFPFYNAFRGTDVRLDQRSRLQATYEQTQGWSSDQYVNASWGATKRRLAMINSVAVVARDVGVHVPYDMGRSLFQPLVAFIPRALWPDKPAHDQLYFGEQFRVTSILARDTSIARSAVGEFLWNFDIFGVVAGMFLIGLGMRYLYRRYGEGPFDPVRRAVYVIALYLVLNLDGAFTPGVVYLVRTLLVIEVMLWVGRRSGLLSAVRATGPGVAEAVPAGSAQPVR